MTKKKIRELSELLIKNGETKINIIFNENNKKLMFELKQTRKFDFDLFCLIKNKEYIKKISF